MSRAKPTPSEAEFILQVKNLSEHEVRFHVSNYYASQEMRKRLDMQVRHLGDKATIGWEDEDDGSLIINEKTGEPTLLMPPVLSATAGKFWGMEKDIAKALEIWAENRLVGRWCLSIPDVGPIITAGLLAHIDVSKAPVAANVWSYAGLNPDAEWPSGEEAKARINGLLGKDKITEEFVMRISGVLGRKAETVLRMATTDAKRQPVKLTIATVAKALSRRPYNAELKQVCFHLGGCIKRGHEKIDSIYGPVYRYYKARVVAKNENGENEQRAKTFISNSAAVKSLLKEGKLPKGNLDRQACNNTVKIFLSHLHAVMYWDRYHKAPPRPFAIQHLGHGHEIRVPNTDMFPGFEDAYYGGKMREAAE
jgi:hypothetical protein